MLSSRKSAAPPATTTTYASAPPTVRLNEPVPTKVVCGPARYNTEVVEVVRKNDAEATALRVELAEVDALIGSLRRGNAELEHVLAECNGQQSVLLSERAQLQYQMDDLQAQLERGAAELAALPGQNADLEAMANSQNERIGDLEARIYEFQNRPPEVEVEAGHGMASDEVQNNLHPHEKIDAKILEFLHAHPDWHVGIEKVSTNYFQFGNPISKKVFIKIVGEEVVARVGGGYVEVARWLEEQRLAFLEAEVMEDGNTTAASRRGSMKLRSMRGSERMSSGGDRRRSSAQGR